MAHLINKPVSKWAPARWKNSLAAASGWSFCNFRINTSGLPLPWWILLFNQSVKPNGTAIFVIRGKIRSGVTQLYAAKCLNCPLADLKYDWGWLKLVQHRDICPKNAGYWVWLLTQIAPMIYPYRLIQVAISRLCFVVAGVGFSRLIPGFNI